MKLDRRKIILILTAVMFLVPLVPPVSGDGMPMYTYYDTGDEDKDLYGNTFETRQLANIELLNDTHQRIDLFLSIFSLDPVQNLTVLVPFRELPEEVNMEEGTDSEFLDRIEFDRIKEEGRKQDLSISTGRLAKRTGNVLWDMSASTVTSPVGPLILYIAREYEEDEWDDFFTYGLEDKQTGGLGDDDYNRNVEQIAHYDFEGASLSVYSVSANATLEDFVSVVDLGSIPTITREVVEEYKDQYVAVIQSEPSPPIEKDTYTWLQNNMPVTMGKIISKVREDIIITYREAQEMTVEYSIQGFREMVDSEANLTEWTDMYGNRDIQDHINRWYNEEYLWRELYMDDEQPFHLRNKMEKLIFAIYGFTDFNGHTLSITTKLNDGKMYFPLGTSKGWDNPIAETVVICRTDESRSLTLNLEPDREAFIGDEHCYLFDIPNDNPSVDVEAGIKDTKAGLRAKAGFSRFIFTTSPLLAFIFALISQFILWMICLLVVRSARKEKINPLSKKNFLLGASNIIISAPITYLLFVSEPFKNKYTEKSLKISFLIFFAIQLIFVCSGVIF